ncbi:FbpB family small basic protein [Aquisalibacillus elongatus]|uniref:Fur-regulated basic protein B n=1 Tax=Aquisalibacillus elongatus TaxID=485577 RepID=A0A3N5BEL1_9BACI|nr:FbpB family small basic protein [Aquisalibacillus elongatus]RPF55887.1 Fur-regulated basic protein B [Aquisalibacillus elongatus]
MLRKKDYVTFQSLIESEKEKIMKNPDEMEKIYDKLDERLSVIKNSEKHA